LPFSDLRYSSLDRRVASLPLAVRLYHRNHSRLFSNLMNSLVFVRSLLTRCCRRRA
jgi:hypothetical protein